MAGEERMVISLNTCLEVTQFLASLVDDGYSHPRSSALILNSTGEIYFTRSGMNIIGETYCHHPVAKLITNALGKHYSLTGDGSKLYVLLLHEILLNIKNKYKCTSLKTEHRIQILQEISLLMYTFLPPIFRCLRGCYPSVQHVIGVDSNDNVKKAVKSVIQTFFQYKFPAAISRCLSCLINDLICRSTDDWSALPSLINYLISNFSSISSKVVASVQDSSVVEGIVLKVTSISKLQRDAIDKRFIVVNDIFKSMQQCNIPVIVQEYSSVKQCLELNYKIYEHILNILTADNIFMVLSSDNIPEEFASLCCEKNVLCIDRIDEEKLEHVINCSGVVTLHDFSDGIKSENVGNADFIKLLIRGLDNYVHIGLAKKPSRIFAHHVILCAPFKSLCKECYSECINSLKVVRQWMFSIEKCYNCSPCRKGEKQFNKTKTKGVSISDEQNTASQNECSDFTTTDLLKPLVCYSEMKADNTMECYNPEQCCTLVGLAYPVGEWEALLNSALCSVISTLDSQFRNSVLLLALSELITKKQSIRKCGSSHFQKKLELMYKKIQDFDTVKYSKASQLSASEIFLEPIASKEKLIYSVLNLVTQLVRLDEIVNVKRLHHVQVQ